MRTFTHLVAGLGLAASLAACGSPSNGGGPTVQASPGRGSGTLRVDARVESSPTGAFPNSTQDDQFVTTYEVRVRKLVTGVLTDVTGADATVRFHVGVASFDVPWDAVNGRYRTDRAGGIARERIEVDVTTPGGDTLTGLARVAPDVHRLTNPTPGASVSLAALAGGPATVTWVRLAPADEAVLLFSNFGDAVVDDTGSHAVPNADVAQVPTIGEPCMLQRANVVDAAAAAALSGSSLEVRIRQEFNFDVVP